VGLAVYGLYGIRHSALGRTATPEKTVQETTS